MSPLVHKTSFVWTEVLCTVRIWNNQLVVSPSVFSDKQPLSCSTNEIVKTKLVAFIFSTEKDMRRNQSVECGKIPKQIC